MLIERYDKKPDPRTGEIQKDWRAWATGNGYVWTDSEAVEYEDVRVFLEIWENPDQADRYLMYLPRIPHTTGDAGERLFITDQDHFDFMRESLTKMATVAVMLAKEKWKVHQDQKSMLN
jgi:nitrous oxidase accessory protein NosD